MPAYSQLDPVFWHLDFVCPMYSETPMRQMTAADRDRAFLENEARRELADLFGRIYCACKTRCWWLDRVMARV
jgi:hypothetical protein